MIRRTILAGALALASCGGPAPMEEHYGQTREAVIDLVTAAAALGKSLSGVQVNEYEVFIECTSMERMHELTGKWPAILGLELMFMIEYPPYREYFVRRAKEHAARGGLVTVTWHQRNPLNVCPRGEYYGCSQFPMTDEELARLLTPGSKENALWLADIDAVAPVLKELGDAGVTLLFRPYHEMNGHWFWWGRKERFADLWRALHERLAGHHGLGDLVWVWSSDKASEAVERYFPGEDTVDFVGADIYSPDRSGEMYETAHRNVAPLHGSGVFGFSEIGLLPSAEIFRRVSPAWFLLWGGEFIDKEWAGAPCDLCNNAEDVAAIFALDEVVTLDGIDWPAGTARFDERARTAPPKQSCPARLL